MVNSYHCAFYDSVGTPRGGKDSRFGVWVLVPILTLASDAFSKPWFSRL